MFLVSMFLIFDFKILAEKISQSPQNAKGLNKIMNLQEHIV